MRISRAVVLMFVCFSTAGCAFWGADSIEWDITAAAPEHYDMWLINAHLEKSGVRSWRAPLGGHSGCCWMGAHGPFGSGGKLDPFPNLIALHWFSFSEQKYYSTLIRVPADLQDRMREPVRHSYQNGTIGFEPRSTLVLGLAPGGEVVVWMMSQRSTAVEVLRVPAVEVPGDPEDFAVLTESYLEDHGDYLKEHGVPLEGW